jgi:hypothetical protein
MRSSANRPWGAFVTVASIGVVLAAVACGGAATSSAPAKGAAPYQGSAPAKPSTDTARGGGSDAASARPVDAATNIPAGVRVERKADMTVQVENGGFRTGFSNLRSLIAEEKGYIVGTQTQPDPHGVKVGTVSFKVPADKFDETITALGKLGTVENLTISGNDVSQQYVDLRARLQNQERQRDALLQLLAQAKTVQETIAIQQQLGSVTETIERLKGQIQFLESVTDYSTFAVTMEEAAPVVRTSKDDWGFQTALSQALHNLVNVINWTILALGYALPFLGIGAAGYFVWRRRRRVTAAPAPA